LSFFSPRSSSSGARHFSPVIVTETERNIAMSELSALNEVRTSIERAIAELQPQARELEKRVENARAVEAEIQARVERLRTEEGEIRERIAGLRSDQQHAENQIAATRERILALG
jgi:chromosome segregation ATPase